MELTTDAQWMDWGLTSHIIKTPTPATTTAYFPGGDLTWKWPFLQHWMAEIRRQEKNLDIDI